LAFADAIEDPLGGSSAVEDQHHYWSIHAQHPSDTAIARQHGRPFCRRDVAEMGLTIWLETARPCQPHDRATARRVIDPDSKPW
jgi:hypothetical protein